MQPGIPGMQTGPGSVSGRGRGPVADWWLGIMEVEGETAAATPVKTIVRTKMRTASFIVGNLWWISSGGRRASRLVMMVPCESF